jgi:hypothetical protein
MRVVRPCVLLCLGTLLVRCGLPDQYYLAPPLAITQATSTSIFFQFNNPDHSVDLNVVFKGFDLYYKFYADASLIEGNAYDSTSPLDVPAQLKSKGFMELCAATDTQPTKSVPLVKVNAAARTDSFTVYVNVNQPTSSTVSFKPLLGLISYYTYNPPSGSLVEAEVRRTMADPAAPGAWKTFLPNQVTPNNYFNTDTDISPQVLTQVLASGGYAYLAMYALSYGVIGISTPSRSAAVYLGYVMIKIGP